MVRYEDTIDAKRPRKPGYRSPPVQSTPAETRRRDFSQQLIAALEAAAAVPERTPGAAQLARAAYDRLQYDFPLLAETELEALVDALRAQLDAQQWLPWPLTAKLLENALEGSLPPAQAAGATSASPPVPAADDGAAPSDVAAAAAVPSQAQEPQQELQAFFQQLAGVLAVKLPRRLLEAPPQDAFAQLTSFEPAAAAHQAAAAAAAASVQPGRQLGAAAVADTAAVEQAFRAMGGPDAPPEQSLCSHRVPADAATASGAAAASVAEGGLQLDEEVFAVEEDGDGCAYEPLQPVPQPSLLRAPGAAGAASQSYTWEGLLAKLAALAAHAQYSQLGGDTSWRRGRLAEDAIAALAAARRHAHADALQGLSSVYVDLLAERITDAPAAVSCFPALCDALGASEPWAAPPRGTAPAMPPGLRSAGGCAARLFAGLPDPSSPTAAAATASQTDVGVEAPSCCMEAAAAAAARRSLAKTVVASLLPPLGAWLGAVAGIKVALPEAIQEDVRLACRLVSAAVLGTQAAGGGNPALADSGVFPALAVLFAVRNLASMDELRRALLLGAASDTSLAAYAAAVPGFTAALSSVVLQGDSDAAAHGAVWTHLLPAAKRPVDLPALEQLLQLNGSEEQQVADLHVTLQLLVDCRTAGGGRRPWVATADARMRALPAMLNAVSMQAASETRQDGAAASGAPAAGSGTSAGAETPGDAAAEENGKDKPAGASPTAAGAQAGRLRRLCRDCIAMLKELKAGSGGQSSKRD